MKNNRAEFDERVDQIVKKVIGLFRNYTLKADAKLIAICENEFPVDYELSEMFEDMKEVNLGSTFDNLGTYDKLLVIKAVVRTHNQLMHGEIAPYGKICYYELEDNSQTYRAFGLDGEFILTLS